MELAAEKIGEKVELAREREKTCSKNEKFFSFRKNTLPAIEPNCESNGCTISQNEPQCLIGRWAPRAPASAAVAIAV